MFSHEIAYRGADLAAKMQKHLIVICGAGALGSNLADKLCRQCAVNVRVIDFDKVEQHNINTQIYGLNETGKVKVDALRNRLFRSTRVNIDAQNKRLDEKNVAKLLKGATLVIDTFDNHASRKVVHEYCTAKGVPCLHSGMFEDYGQVCWREKYIVPRDPPPAADDVCDNPLARNLIDIVVGITAEEVMDFCLSKKPRQKSWSFTLKDLTISAY